MKVHFDQQTDAVYFRLDDSKIIESEEVKPGIIFDFNDRNQVVGIEILQVGKRVPASQLKQMQFEIV
ncbi:MAG: DUF2283 domain-containing protein [Betaproteobacteria bacterium]|nr:DUF2283 domain-containing protein [Betaproteobacteria bacterium]